MVCADDHYKIGKDAKEERLHCHRTCFKICGGKGKDRRPARQEIMFELVSILFIGKMAGEVKRQKYLCGSYK